LWEVWQDEVFGTLSWMLMIMTLNTFEVSTDDDSDSLIYEKLDKPNYISADYCYYPESCYELDSSDDEFLVYDPCFPLVIA
jgi:hypothetical protein